MAESTRLLHRRLDQARGPGRLVGEDRHPDSLAQGLQLFDRGRPLEIGGHQHRSAAVLLQVESELAGGRGLAGALQADHEDRQRRGSLLERGVGRAEGRDQLVMNDLDDLLAGGEALVDLLPHRPLPDPVEEAPNDRNVDIGLEQRQSHLAQSGVDIGLAQAAFPAETGEDAFESFRDRVKHWVSEAVGSRQAGSEGNRRSESLIFRERGRRPWRLEIHPDPVLPVDVRPAQLQRFFLGGGPQHQHRRRGVGVGTGLDHHPAAPSTP